MVHFLLNGIIVTINKQLNKNIMNESIIKKVIFGMIVYTLIVMLATAIFWIFVINHEVKEREEQIKELSEQTYKTDVNALIDAFIYVESNGDIKAKNGSHVGCIQIAPVMVDEANRILGVNKYTLSDRESKEKSIEIFKIVQEYYNPEYDLHKACKVWHPTSKIGYNNAIERKYKELTNRQ